MALSDFTGPDFIDAWTRDLDQRWPERAAISECVVRTLVEWRGVASHRTGLRDAGLLKEKHHKKIRLLELGIGAGGLAQAVLDSLADGPEAGQPCATEYTGIDIQPALVKHGKERLGSAGYPDTCLVQEDLKNDGWTRGNGPFDAVISLQTFHDLGGIDALETVYRQIHGLLVPGGILVNADFVIPFEKDDPDRPRRLPIETHQELLDGIGFVDFRCEMQEGKMACMSARKP